jgi:hypothetical protein
MPPEKLAQRAKKNTKETQEVRDRIADARKRQSERFKKAKDVSTNADMGPQRNRDAFRPFAQSRGNIDVRRAADETFRPRLPSHDQARTHDRRSRKLRYNRTASYARSAPVSPARNVICTGCKTHCHTSCIVSVEMHPSAIGDGDEAFKIQTSTAGRLRVASVAIHSKFGRCLSADLSDLRHWAAAHARYSIRM